MVFALVRLNLALSIMLPNAMPNTIANTWGYGKIYIMIRSRQVRFFMGVGLAIALLVILLVVIFSQSSAPKVATPKPMASYANDPTAQVAMLIDGPVNAVSEHNQVQVIINNSLTTLNILTGYDGAVKSSSSFPMSVSAFHVFLRSLEFAGYNNGTNDPRLSQASGFCPTGDRYIFTFDDNNRQISRYWSTSCSGPHTYNGDSGLTMQLFEAQVPNYVNLTSNLNI